MKIYFNYFRPLSLAIIVLSLLSSCKDEVEDLFGGDEEEEETELKVQIASNGEFGDILVDQDNQSLYFFAGDVSGESNCNGGCAGVWPALAGEAYELELGSGLSNGDFSAITREDGQKQIAFKGWPLYYFSPEADGVLEAPGDTQGDGRGGVFHIAKPDYSVLLGQQSVVEGEDPVVYLVDEFGVSLYRSINDGENVSNCAGGCAEVWPPFEAPEELIIPSSLSPDDFDSFYREDDLGPQLTFQGSPLYFFTPDEGKRGSVLGQGGAGETFFVVEPTL
ncbi:hypothetical protein WJR50_29665 [Catalinimonas sp. 4WD22]|uniref:hypothetical protein n=1 Tax=Catalinimonas locisalis TaxID=3133978 RepID=UPI003100F131